MVQNERELLAVAFPRLSDQQIQALGRCSETGLAQYEKGHTLIDYGDRNYSFFVIVSGLRRRSPHTAAGGWLKTNSSLHPRTRRHSRRNP